MKNFLQRRSTEDRRTHNPQTSGSTPFAAPNSRTETPGLLVEAGPTPEVNSLRGLEG